MASRALSAPLRGSQRFSFHAVSEQMKKSEAGSEPFKSSNKRNIGIIAHIDAGKTTCTEKLLYLTGASNNAGSVDDGNTVTDFMDLERERGITIQSAFVSSNWKDHRINLIDTPGHVDFTVEVERSLRVMDGAVTVLDASAGVQAQTLTVWNQAAKFKLPSVFFINKMDKAGADFNRSIKSIENRLCRTVVPIVIPVMSSSKQLAGYIDLLNRAFLDAKGNDAKWTTFDENFSHYPEFNAGYETLISNLCDINRDFEQFVVSTDEPISKEAVVEALRKSTLDLSLSPLACGSALKNVPSVIPILDMVVNYLPSPPKIDNFVSVQSDGIREKVVLVADLCALVYKISHDKLKGRLSYARVFKGLLRNNANVLNANQGINELNFKLFIPFGDFLQPVESVGHGDIVVITGLKSVVSGDTLINGSAARSHAHAGLDKFVLEGISSPDPVFSCSIEAPSSSKINKLDEALVELCAEDPSLRVHQDYETGQTIIEGMGELHLEVVKERLRREYDLNVFMGSLRVAYRALEIMNSAVERTTFTEDVFGDGKQKQWCSVTMKLEPTEKVGRFTGVHVQLNNNDDDSTINKIRPTWLKAINEGCALALYNGPVLGLTVCSPVIKLMSLSVSSKNLSLALLNAGASRCVKEALEEAGTNLIEPVMSMEVTLICDERGDLCSSEVLHELSLRRATILRIEQDNYGHLIVIHASLPLSESSGITNRIRALSSGMCSLHLSFAEYQHVPTEEHTKIMKKRLHQGI